MKPIYEFEGVELPEGWVATRFISSHIQYLTHGVPHGGRPEQEIYCSIACMPWARTGWHYYNSDWVWFDTSECKTLEEVCALALALWRMR
jgi:hypothetical protein